MPLVALASRLRLHVVGAVVHRQLQRIHARTAVLIRVRIGVRTGFRIGCAVPLVALASYLRLHVVCAVVDGQMQRHHRITTRSIGQCVSRGVGAFGVGFAINPDESLAGNLRVNTRVGVVDRHLQRIRARTT